MRRSQNERGTQNRSKFHKQKWKWQNVSIGIEDLPVDSEESDFSTATTSDEKPYIINLMLFKHTDTADQVVACWNYQSIFTFLSFPWAGFFTFLKSGKSVEISFTSSIGKPFTSVLFGIEEPFLCSLITRPRIFLQIAHTLKWRTSSVLLSASQCESSDNTSWYINQACAVIISKN